ncbi:MAG: TetR/AcrR family transcriptional regulator [Marmoricola sp.]
MTSARGSSVRRLSPRPDEAAEDASLARVFNADLPRERILAAAIRIVADRGFGALTVKDIAEAAGLKAPGLYSHFPSKEAIITEAVSRVLADFMDTMATITGPDAEGELRETVRRHVRYQIDNRQIARVADLVLNTATAGHFLSTEEYDVLLSVQRAHLDLVRERVAAFAPTRTDAEVSIASMAIIAICDRVANWFQTDGGLDTDEVADLHWDLVRSMLA